MSSPDHQFRAAGDEAAPPSPAIADGLSLAEHMAVYLLQSPAAQASAIDGVWHGVSYQTLPALTGSASETTALASPPGRETEYPLWAVLSMLEPGRVTGWLLMALTEGTSDAVREAAPLLRENPLLIRMDLTGTFSDVHGLVATLVHPQSGHEVGALTGSLSDDALDLLCEFHTEGLLTSASVVSYASLEKRGRDTEQSAEETAEIAALLGTLLLPPSPPGPDGSGPLPGLDEEHDVLSPVLTTALPAVHASPPAPDEADLSGTWRFLGTDWFRAGTMLHVPLGTPLHVPEDTFYHYPGAFSLKKVGESVNGPCLVVFDFAAFGGETVLPLEAALQGPWPATPIVKMRMQNRASNTWQYRTVTLCWHAEDRRLEGVYDGDGLFQRQRTSGTIIAWKVSDQPIEESTQLAQTLSDPVATLPTPSLTPAQAQALCGIWEGTGHREQDGKVVTTYPVTATLDLTTGLGITGNFAVEYPRGYDNTTSRITGALRGHVLAATRLYVVWTHNVPGMTIATEGSAFFTLSPDGQTLTGLYYQSFGPAEGTAVAGRMVLQKSTAPRSVAPEATAG